jgi:hypothetical protein
MAWQRPIKLPDYEIPQDTPLQCATGASLHAIRELRGQTTRAINVMKPLATLARSLECRTFRHLGWPKRGCVALRA